MKKLTGLIFIFLSVLSISMKAQKTYFTPVEPERTDSVESHNTTQRRDMVADNKARIVEQKPDTAKTSQMYAWKLDTRSGERIKTEIDRSVENFHRKSLVEGNGLAVQYTGNLGSAAQSQLFFERGESSTYKFLDMFGYYYKEPQNVVFYNTKIPYSNIYYQSGGGRNESEERFKTLFTLNDGKKFNIGFNIDYIYSRGYYANLSNKQFTYDVFTSYITDRYQMHAYAMNNYYNNSENGGITDDRFITRPDDPAIAGQWSRGKSSKDIPVNLERLWNTLRGRQIFISNKYDVGSERELVDTDGETEFIPVASFILTNHYADQRRQFASKDQTMTSAAWRGEQILRTDSMYYQSKEAYDDLNNGYNNQFSNSGNQTPVNDFMSYWSFKNTLAVTLNEGFKDWVKFGLTAFVEQDIRKFTLPRQFPGAVDIKNQNSTVIGGMLTKQQSRFLRYNLKADLGVIGYNLGEFRVEGDVTTYIRFAGKDASVKANAYIKNLKPTFYENYYRTKYMNWNHNLSDVRRVYVGGEINIPHTKTVISGGVENLSNYIYYDTERQIAQTSKNIQVITARIDQKLKAGIFHWDNSVAYQLTSQKDILPLPSISAYTNIYIQTKLVNVLTVQLGVDANYVTEYYAQAYDPALLQFHNQDKTKVGNFPFVNAYLNLNLKNTRFFLMMYNIAEQAGSNGYFNTPHYPTAPRSLRLGLSWDFYN